MIRTAYKKDTPKQFTPYGQRTVDCKNTVNQIILIGRLGGDPDLISFKNGSFVVNLSVATSTKYTDKRTGQKTETTYWHRIRIYDMTLSEWVFKTFQKGQLIYIEGKMRQGQYQKEVKTSYFPHIEARRIQEI